LPFNQKIDFLTIDVEGMDLEVLQSNNFYKYKPKVVLVEIFSSNFTDIDNNEIAKFMKSYNYSIYSKTFNTIFFIDNDLLKA